MDFGFARLKEGFELRKPAAKAAPPERLACPAANHIGQPGDSAQNPFFGPAVCAARGPKHLVCRPCTMQAATAALEASEQTGQG